MSKSTLKSSFLFQGLTDEHLDKIVGVANELSFNAGSTLFRTGQDADSLYIIEMGTVKVMKVDPQSGDSEEIARLGTGSHFGEMAMVLQGHKRTATIEATEMTRVIELKRGQLESLCAEDLALGKAFYEVVARGLARRLNLASDNLAHFKNMALN